MSPHTHPWQGCDGSWGDWIVKEEAEEQSSKAAIPITQPVGGRAWTSDTSHLTLHPLLCPVPMLPALSGQKQTQFLNDKWSSIHHT